eukprot:14813806-Heterocapsa_arctica.AAC.1
MSRVGRLACLACLAAWLASWLPGCLAAWLPGCLAGCPAAWLPGGLCSTQLRKLLTFNTMLEHAPLFAGS